MPAVSETPIVPATIAAMIERLPSSVHESIASGMAIQTTSREIGARRPSPPSRRITSSRLRGRRRRRRSHRRSCRGPDRTSQVVGAGPADRLRRRRARPPPLRILARSSQPACHSSRRPPLLEEGASFVP